MASKSPAKYDLLAPFVEKLGDAGIQVSLFIAPELRQIEAAARIGAPAIEIHVGPWCEALAEGRAREADAEWRRIVDAAPTPRTQLGLEVHAGPWARLYDGGNHLWPFRRSSSSISAIFLVGEAIFIGLGESVRRMRAKHGSSPRHAAA